MIPIVDFNRVIIGRSKPRFQIKNKESNNISKVAHFMELKRVRICIISKMLVGLRKPDSPRNAFPPTNKALLRLTIHR